MSIQSRFNSGLRWLGMARLASQIVSWIGTLYVMRLLAPSDYGLAAICSSILMLATLVAEFGFGAAIVQADKLSREQQRSVFGAALLFSAIAAGLMALAAPAIADFYHAPEAASLIRCSALTLVLSALATLPDAHLRREMSFVRLSSTEFAANLSATATTVGMALAGGGVWALIVGPLAGTVVRTVMLHLLAGRTPWPSLDLGPARHLLGFGFQVALSRLAGYVLGQSDVLIAGRVLSKQDLGAYSIAMHLAMLPMTKLMGVLNTVAFPAIAAMRREERVDANVLLTPLRVVAHVVTPLMWGLAAIAPWLVPVLLGPTWQAAILPLQIVCLALPLRLVSVLLSTALQGLGHAGLDLRNTVTGVLVFPVLFLLGSHWGVVGLALAWLVGLPVLIVLNLRRSSKRLGVGVRDVATALMPAIACSGAMATVVHGLGYALEAHGTAVPGLVAMIGAAVVCQCALLWWLDRRSALALLDLVPRRAPAVARG